MFEKIDQHSSPCPENKKLRELGRFGKPGHIFRPSIFLFGEKGSSNCFEEIKKWKSLFLCVVLRFRLQVQTLFFITVRGDALAKTEKWSKILSWVTKVQLTFRRKKSQPLWKTFLSLQTHYIFLYVTFRNFNTYTAPLGSDNRSVDGLVILLYAAWKQKASSVDTWIVSFVTEERAVRVSINKSLQALFAFCKKKHFHVMNII